MKDKDKNYFKFDISNFNSWWNNSEIINEIVSQIYTGWQIPVSGIQSGSAPMTDSIPSYGEALNPSLYVGCNQFKEHIWKDKYFIKDSLQTEYLNHLQCHAAYFVQQPLYYNSMFEILN